MYQIRTSLLILELAYNATKNGNCLRPSDVRKKLGRSKGAIGNLLKNLIKKGLLEKEKRGCYKLTEKGLEELKKTQYYIAEFQTELAKWVAALGFTRATFEGWNPDFGPSTEEKPPQLADLMWAHEVREKVGNIMDDIDAIRIRGHFAKPVDLGVLLDKLGWTREALRVDACEHEPTAWRRWCENDESYIFDFFEPPIYNIIIKLFKDGRHVEVWSLAAYDDEFKYYRDYAVGEGGFYAPLSVLLSYTLSYVFILDAVSGMLFGENRGGLLIDGVVALSRDEKGPLALYSVLPTGYTAPKFMAEVLNLRGFEGARLMEGPPEET
ncbi:hypothetical protein Pisl_1930 [Pyrobaculum islandicum DSM 4184]|uniref:Uncharacterized protein n=1 Tax=Pyrobaculum islandicum (strain DSM 4184 / JCM 9189 / GEO3) TaxID=384616 RepID=A1RVU5_PYRIL|nr:winged helix DNA-binding protein [Pyrobaculum islandicum]ABL89077.1 hypothetical protein Pisl_1930 [Pyrobaculum islandicum DSM 4184]